MKLGLFLPSEEFRQVDRINKKVNRIFNRKFVNEVDRRCYQNYGNQKKITVITPFYNAEKYIENCILSVVSQDYENYKFVLIDDASTDNSLQVTKNLLGKLPINIQKKIKLTQNFTNMGAVYNHWHALQKVDDDSIILLLDGDDWLVNNNTIFNFYNNLYQQGIEFAYGSCWSLVDNIPLIAQNYPNEVKNNKTYRSHKFPWNMPYTHLRTFTKSLFNGLGEEKFKDANGDWLRAGGDGALFYELIERADPNKVIAVKEIIYNYNDLNPLNDYKINNEEQTRNANYIISK
jgi:glycosyltransferase involved in cell wall biosynthesis